MIALCFDTETTGLIDNHTIKLENQPRVIEWYSQLIDLDEGLVIEELELLIRPPDKLPDITPKLTGITDEMLAGCPAFAEVADRIRRAVEGAPLAIAHNASYDTEIINMEFERLGQPRLDWPRVICTVEQTIGLRGYRLTLSNLHIELLGAGFPEAHRARKDVEALVRCVVVMRKAGWL